MIEDGSKSVIALTKTHLSEWSSLEDDNFIVEPLTGGATNILYTCALKDDVKDIPLRKVIVRYFGNGLLLDRELEFIVCNGTLPSFLVVLI